MKKLLMLMTLLAMICNGISTFAQENRERIEQEKARRERMTLINEGCQKYMMPGRTCNPQGNRPGMACDMNPPLSTRMMPPPAGKVPNPPICTGPWCSKKAPMCCPMMTPGTYNCPMVMPAGKSGCPMMGKTSFLRSSQQNCAQKLAHLKPLFILCHIVFFMVILIVILIVHILVAIWVYQDIKKRNTGSGIWIVIALLTGLLGTAVYALVRIGENKK